MAMTKFLIRRHNILQVETRSGAEIMLVHDEQIL